VVRGKLRDNTRKRRRVGLSWHVGETESAWLIRGSTSTLRWGVRRSRAWVRG